MTPFQIKSMSNCFFQIENIMKGKTRTVFMVQSGQNLNFKACTKRGYTELPWEEGSLQVSYLIQPSHKS